MYNNSRRGGGNNQNNMRRSGGKTNFVPGGQLTPQRGGVQQPQRPATGGQNVANKPQQQQAYQSQQASNPTPAARQQASTSLQAATPAPTVVPPSPIDRKPVVQPSPIERKPVVQPTPTERKPTVQPMEQTPIQTAEVQNGEDGKKDTEKKSWMNRKIPKKEKIRRRNLRLSKLLQPKNALKILHELVKNPTFNVVESQGQYKAILTVAGVEHTGLGKSKAGAKNVASENAIKYLLKHKNIGAVDLADDGSEKMDTYDANDSPAEAPLPWQQVASFALYKLFDSWGESPGIVKDEPQPKKVNSAKKMPENPSTLNPIMVINQMYPQATFNEQEPIGAVPNITFKIVCDIDGQNFEGSGPSKKVAKKQAAYAACHSLMGITYPPEEYTPPQ